MNYAKLKKIIIVTLSFCLLMIIRSTPALADQNSDSDPIEYIDADGSTVSCSDYTLITDQTTLGTENAETWYVVKDNAINIGTKIEISGYVNIIVMDGARLNANYAINVPNNCQLSIYGQTEQTGMLFVPGQGPGWRNGICLNGNGKLYINGGIVDVTGGWNGEAAVGGGTSGTKGGEIYMNRGKFIATGGNSTALDSKINVYGGITELQTGGSELTATDTIKIYGGSISIYNTNGNGKPLQNVPSFMNVDVCLETGETPETATICNYSQRNLAVNNGTRYLRYSICDNHNFNEVNVCDYCGFMRVKPVTSSVSSGTYYDEISVVLSTQSENVKIYYTIDGSEPDENSFLYTVPIVLNRNLDEESTIYTIKAVTINALYGRSSVSTFEYKYDNFSDRKKTEIVNAANGAIGCGFVYGMAGPRVFDNYGFLYYCMKTAGIQVPRLGQNMVEQLKKWAVSSEYETLDYIQENGCFRINPEPGDVVLFHPYTPDNLSYAPYVAVYTKRENGKDYVITITGPSQTVSELEVGEITSIIGYDIVGVELLHLQDIDDICIDSINAIINSKVGKPFSTTASSDNEGINSISILWTDKDGNVVSGDVGNAPEKYTIHFEILPKSGYYFDTSTVVNFNKNNTVSDFDINADGTISGTLEIYAVEYAIVKGNNSGWKSGSNEVLIVTGNGNFSKFVGIKVDGRPVDKANYDVKSGSTIITLKPEFLNSLSVGDHTIEILWTDGSKNTKFTVLSKDLTETNSTDSNTDNSETGNNIMDIPETGDNTTVILLFIILGVSGMYFTCCQIRR